MEAVTCLTLRSGWKRMMYSLGVKRQANVTVALRLIVTLILVMRSGKWLAVLKTNRFSLIYSKSPSKLRFDLIAID